MHVTKENGLITDIPFSIVTFKLRNCSRSFAVLQAPNSQKIANGRPMTRKCLDEICLQLYNGRLEQTARTDGQFSHSSTLLMSGSKVNSGQG